LNPGTHHLLRSPVQISLMCSMTGGRSFQYVEL
jgi:hypothetical protein